MTLSSTKIFSKSFFSSCFVVNLLHNWKSDRSSYLFAERKPNLRLMRRSTPKWVMCSLLRVLSKIQSYRVQIPIPSVQKSVDLTQVEFHHAFQNNKIVLKIELWARFSTHIYFLVWGFSPKWHWLKYVPHICVLIPFKVITVISWL